MEVMPDNYIKLMFELEWSTGLRIQELLDLKKDDIEFDKDKGDKGDKGKVFVKKGKGDK
jgi:site-specific recombinase XerD